MNNFILIARYLDNPTPKIIRVVVTRNYKNDEGAYDTDILPIQLFDTSTNIFGYIKRGDTIGIKGRIESLEPTHTPQLIAEKLTFLSSKEHDKMGEGEI